mmetsp:Transcript_3155/g.5957  ORF Transcript_3155/g.5957 Transcript_3155/m.5957 type:complete len:299 (+) Transcript_3155:710-1606(+)
MIRTAKTPAIPPAAILPVTQQMSLRLIKYPAPETRTRDRMIQSQRRPAKALLRIPRLVLICCHLNWQREKWARVQQKPPPRLSMLVSLVSRRVLPCLQHERLKAAQGSAGKERFLSRPLTSRIRLTTALTPIPLIPAMIATSKIGAVPRRSTRCDSSGTTDLPRSNPFCLHREQEFLPWLVHLRLRTTLTVPLFLHFVQPMNNRNIISSSSNRALRFHLHTAASISTGSRVRLFVPIHLPVLATLTRPPKIPLSTCPLTCPLTCLLICLHHTLPPQPIPTFPRSVKVPHLTSCHNSMS